MAAAPEPELSREELSREELSREELSREELLSAMLSELLHRLMARRTYDAQQRHRTFHAAGLISAHSDGRSQEDQEWIDAIEQAAKDQAFWDRPPFRERLRDHFERVGLS